MNRRNIRPFGAALLSLVLTAACAPVALPPAAEDGAASRQAAAETLVAGYTNISEKYLQPVSLETMALEGMRGLSAIDPSLAVAREGRSITLTAENREVARFPVPAENDVGAWAALTTDVFAAGRAASPELRKASVEQIYEALFDGALSNLDIYSRYAGTDEARRNRAKREGFGGIGLRFRIKDGAVRVVHVIADTPAARAGIRKHDRITHIDGAPTRSMEKKQVVDTLRGPVKSRVAVTVVRPGEPESLRFELQRAHIVPNTVVASLSDGVALLRITGFNQHTARSLAAKLKKLSAKPGARIKGVVLDLRGNPGGLLKQSVKVVDLFLAQGDIIDTRGRHPDSFQHYEAAGGDLAHGLPLAVLVDGKSASAAEIVAAALQDRGRAVVIGTASFGKGTVQTVIHLPNDGEITLTWSRLIAPSGYVLHGLGVLPSICTSGSEGKSGGELIRTTLAARLKTTNVFAAWRAKGPLDEDRRHGLRAACPAERRRGTIEVEVARRLVADRTLYGRVLDLVTDTAAAEN